MGCGASTTSRNDVIKSVGSNPKKVSDTNGKSPSTNSQEIVDSQTSSILSEASTIPASEYFQQNPGKDQDTIGPLHKNGSLPPLKPPRTAKLGMEQDDSPSSDREPTTKKFEPVAFEVPAIDPDNPNEDASIIKKHPPRRIRKTIDEQLGEPVSLTQEILVEKVQLANERRNQVLNQRVASARQKSAKAGGRVRNPEGYINEFGKTMESEKEGLTETG